MMKWVVVDKPKEFRPRFVVRPKTSVIIDDISSYLIGLCIQLVFLSLNKTRLVAGIAVVRKRLNG